ncbi:hypothetical protein [Nonomuraea sp. NPDC050786]|uniref:hypothetical protein n=1 Tax=Nonomuraea sp. NPDC050786 TaxID=3154840 RepID=UPI0033C3E699
MGRRQPLGRLPLTTAGSPFRTGIEHRTKSSGTPIDAYHATAGAFRNMMGTLTPEMFPGDPIRAEFDVGRQVALSTDFPGSAEHAVL